MLTNESDAAVGVDDDYCCYCSITIYIILAVVMFIMIIIDPHYCCKQYMVV